MSVWKNNYLPLFFVIFTSSVIPILSQTDIKKVDFNNFTYSALCGGESEKDALSVTVKNGTIKNIRTVNGVTETIDEDLPTYFNSNKPLYYDLTGDGKEEAVVVTECNTGGTANFTEGYVFTLKNGKPVLIFRIEGGDRAYGSLVSIKFSKATLIVKRNDPLNGAECCPLFTKTRKYIWNGKTFVPTGKPLLKKIAVR